jgi:hypothetical protein
MNTGIQDGYNLAWKMAAVLRGAADAKILETYNQERLENAENLLKTTDRFFNLVASPEPILAYLRTHVFPYIAGVAFSIDAVKKFVFPRVSQIAINYRGSSLSENKGDFPVKAGDRMPYFEIEGASIYEKLKEPKFHLLAFSDGQNSIPDMSQALGDYASYADFHELPLYPNIAKTFGSKESFIVLLRPDNYIGLISENNSPETIRDYLKYKVRYSLTTTPKPE